MVYLQLAIAELVLWSACAFAAAVELHPRSCSFCRAVLCWCRCRLLLVCATSEGFQYHGSCTGGTKQRCSKHAASPPRHGRDPAAAAPPTPHGLHGWHGPHSSEGWRAVSVA